MAKPKLALIPAAQGSKLFSVLPSSGVGDFDFTRDTIATRINSQGLIEEVDDGVSRLNYPMIDGKVVGCPHHILEPQSTNLIQYSEDFSTWTTFRSSVTANDIVSPDGSQNAEKIIQQSGQTSSGGVYQNLTLSNSTVYTYSVFLKSGGYDFGVIRIDGGQYAWFDLSSGAIGSITGSGSSSIEDFGNGWYRCSFTITTTSTTGQPHIYIANSDGSQALSGADGVKGIYAWGAQLEQGSYPTSYIPTNGEANGVTRAAETANGSGDADTFNDSEGVLMAEISALDSESTNKMITISNGSNSTRILIRYVGTTLLAQLRISGANQYEFGYDPTNIKDNFKIAIKYKANDFSFFVNGFELDSSNSGSTFSDGTLTELAFDDGGGSNDFYGKTKEIGYYDTILTDAELEYMTSYRSLNELVTELNLNTL